MCLNDNRNKIIISQTINKTNKYLATLQKQYYYLHGLPIFTLFEALEVDGPPIDILQGWKLKSAMEDVDTI